MLLVGSPTPSSEGQHANTRGTHAPTQLSDTMQVGRQARQAAALLKQPHVDGMGRDGMGRDGTGRALIGQWRETRVQARQCPTRSAAVVSRQLRTPQSSAWGVRFACL